MADEEPRTEHPSTSLHDEDLEAKLNAFDEKVKAAGGKRMPDVPSWEYKRKQQNVPDDGAGHRSLGIGISAAYSLVGCMFAGWIIGYLIDRSAHTGTTWQAVLGLVGSVAGLAYVILLISRSNK